jgi:hypothetical protein
MLLSPSWGNWQKGKLSIDLWRITQAQHFLWFGQSVLGQIHSVTLGQLIFYSLPSFLSRNAP